MLPEDQRTREVFEFYIDKCAFFKVEWKIHIFVFSVWCRLRLCSFPFIMGVLWYICFISHALWNAKSMCIFRRNVHFVHEKYNECYKMGWLGKIIWKYRDMELSLHQFKNESLPDDITNPNGLINFTLQMVDRSFTTLKIKASGIHVKTGMKPGWKMPGFP